MAIYNPSIPNASDLISVSQSNIKDNFTIIDSGFAQNHVGLTSSSNIGKHNKVELPQQGTLPTVGSATDGIIYTQSLSGAPALQYRIKPGATTFSYSIPIVIDAGDFTINGTGNTFDFNGQPAMMGTLLAIDKNDQTRTLLSPFFWNGSNKVYVPNSTGSVTFPFGQLPSGTQLQRFFAQGTSSVLQVITTSSTTFRLKIWGTILT